MREIKFRAKIATMDSWVYGHYAFVDEYHVMYEEVSKPVIIKSNTLGQYTGLKDVNGVEIFEGDIVIGKGLDFQGMGVVQYFSPRFEIIGVKQHEGLFRVLESCCEVIGNVFENAEILEVNK